MRKNLIVIFVFLCLAALLTLWLDRQTQPKSVPVDQSEVVASPSSAPDFAMADIQGRKIQLSQFKGKIVILHFWATWCAPCIEEFPKLLSVSSIFKDRVVFLAVSSDMNKRDLDKFLKTQQTDLLQKPNVFILWDRDRAITHDLYQTFEYPETILIDQKSDMVRKVAGDADWTSKEMKNYLVTLTAPLANKTATP